MSANRLPSATQESPICSACGNETTFDDGLVCFHCCLTFDADLVPSFMDDYDETCAAPCSNGWHKPHAIRKDITYDCQPCALPRGHTSNHWTGCVPTAATS